MKANTTLIQSLALSGTDISFRDCLVSLFAFTTLQPFCLA